LRSFLGRHRKIAVDSNIFIYAVEANERYARLADAVSEWIEKPGHAAVTSTITLTELLVKPYRGPDDLMARTYHALLTRYPGLTWIPVDLQIADLAAQLRAKHRLRTPDSIQAATAIHAGATGLVSNDPVFARIGAVESIVFDDLIPDTCPEP
jgi:predicted nucleic acid-binding protein